MGFDPADQDIVRLLTKLKQTGGEYPEQMLAARRQGYLRKIAEVGVGIGAGMGLENAAKNAGTAKISAATSRILETVLVIAIAAEASTVAYLYRAKLADLFNTLISEPRVEAVNPSPVVTTSVEIQGVNPSPAIPSIIPSVIPTESTVIPTATPIPGVADENNNNNSDAIQLNSTPAPNSSSNGNNGNHYGQTPKPERTKENSGNNDQPPKDNKDNPPDGDNAKPPKDKGK